MSLVFEAPNWGAYPPGHECPADSTLPFGTHHVDLQSGYHRDVVIPSLKQWVEYGEIPDPGLAEMAIKIEWTDWTPPADPTPEERQRRLELMVLTVSRMCRPELPLEFVRGRTGPAGADGVKAVEPAMHWQDVETLWAVALGRVVVGEAREARARLLAAVAGFRDRPNGSGAPADLASQATGPGGDDGRG